MVAHHEANKPVVEKAVLSSGEPDASATDTPSSGATPAETEDPESDALPKNDTQSEPEKLGEAELASPATASASNIRITVGEAELGIPVGKAPVVSANSVTTAASDAGKENAKASTMEEMPVKIPPAEGKKFITLERCDGGEFMLPLALCQTWKGMEDLIKLSYGDNERAKKKIDKGEYNLWTKGGAKVLRHCWDMLVEPGWWVVIGLESRKRFGSNSSDSDSSSDSENGPDAGKDKPGEKGKFETKYTRKVDYTVAYYRKSIHSRESPEFLYSMSYDDPVVLERPGNKARELPVLEEKISVTVPSLSPTSNTPKRRSKRAPKLDVGDIVEKTSLHIHSPLLLNALRSIIKYSSKAPSGNVADELKVGEFLHPYADLFYHKQELSDYKKETTGPRANHTPEYNAECDRHIDFLLEYLDQESNVQLKSLEAKWAKKTPTTTFAGFWLLMKPGSDVYVEEDGQLNAYVVHSVSGGVKYLSQSQWSTSAQSYVVRVWNLGYDGKVIKPMFRPVRVPVFDNERDIKSLPLFPTRIQDKIDGGARRKQLIERGKKVFRFARGPTFLEYTGLGLKPGWKKYNRARVVVEHESQPWGRAEFMSMHTWHLSRGPTSIPERPRGLSTEQMSLIERITRPLGSLDTEQISLIERIPRPLGSLGTEQTNIGERARGPRCECSRCKDLDTVREKYIFTTFSDYDIIDPKETRELSEHQCMLCMSHMFGFILKDRTYDLLDVSGLVDVKTVDNAIDRLVMRPEENKDTIKAIVKTYADSGQGELFSADFIRGKGEGQIFLLHGPPGTGKTLTAGMESDQSPRGDADIALESVAEYTKRPLLSITAADLGHEPIELEKNLLRFFKDASNWDAIVLLDEADVYLERRSAHDLKRNSVVSIFLRAMDYFQGILFLTTNRVGHFDEAFMSRIHVSIGYERLDEKAREQIWENLFRKLKEDHKNGGPEIRYEYEAKEYVKKNEEVRKLQWNGREIRNAFQTAVALAVFDARIAREKRGCDEDSIPEVKERHLSQVVSMSAAFKDYITATHEGIEDADFAYKLGIRHDGHQRR